MVRKIGHNDFWSGNQENGGSWIELGKVRLEAEQGKVGSLTVEF
jgi:hypothetical protein